MKKTKKLLPILLTAAMGMTATLAFTACDQSYTTTETDALIAQLQAKIDGNKSELDDKIAALTKEYKTKDDELLAQITANRQSISALQSEYESKVAELEKADTDNKKAIDDLKTEYTAKVTELENAISAANATIESNKTELNGAISALTSAYEAKMTEIDTLLQTLQNTDTSQDEKIAELVGKITALEQATRITDVKFADNGYLIVTFGDGSTQTVKAPAQHVHTFGGWTAFSAEDTYCESRLFFRVCSDCHGIEWKQGEYSDHDWDVITIPATCHEQGYDQKTCEICGKVEKTNYTPVTPHPWEKTYSTDDSYHWFDCATCDEVKDKAEHTDDGNGNCEICGYVIGPTAGILYDVSDGIARVVGYEGTATRIRIADTYNGCPVTEICDDAFRGNTNITEVTIGNGVTSIGEYAFESCSSLTSVTIPDGVTTIGKYAFESCSSLTSVTIGNGVTTIGYRAFYDCSKLENIYITDLATWCNIAGLGNLMEHGSSNKNLYVNGELLTELVIPDSVTTIGESAFYYCSSLTSVTIPDSVTTIGYDAFYGCSKLENIYITDLATWCNIAGLGNLMGCNSSNKNLYVNGKLLTELVIPDGVTTIGYEAFGYCSSLTSVTIPASVTTIGYSAFSACSLLKNVYYQGTESDWAKIEMGSSNYDLTGATRYYYSESEPTDKGMYWHYVDGVPTVWNV